MLRSLNLLNTRCGWCPTCQLIFVVWAATLIKLQSCTARTIDSKVGLAQQRQKYMKDVCAMQAAIQIL